MSEVRARSDVLLRIAENQRMNTPLTPNTPWTILPDVSIPAFNTLPPKSVSGWIDELQVHLKLEETTMRPASTIPSLNTIPAIDLNEESRDVVEENTDVAENRKDSADLTDDESVDPAPGSKGKEKRYA
jgi:hypothetical protein